MAEERPEETAEEREYLLGTDRAEIERLRFQAKAWVKEAYALWELAGLRAGDVVLDLGCGPGFTSLELARVVGPTGRVIARDKSGSFLDFLRAECSRLSLAQVEPSLGPVEELDLPAEHLDAAYARWLFCWLSDPGDVMERVARSLKPGGIVMVQDYLDWAAMKLVPGSAAFDRVVDACMQSWQEGGATIDIVDHVPSLAEECGLVVEHLRPVARIGEVGSLEWQWLTEFFQSYLPKLVDQGLLEQGELDAWRRDWDRRAMEGKSYCYTPTMADVILRKRS